MMKWEKVVAEGKSDAIAVCVVPVSCRIVWIFFYCYSRGVTPALSVIFIVLFAFLWPKYAYITGSVPSHLLPTDKHAVPTSEWCHNDGD
jgi:hypothetical protein